MESLKVGRSFGRGCSNGSGRGHYENLHQGNRGLGTYIKVAEGLERDPGVFKP